VGIPFKIRRLSVHQNGERAGEVAVNTKSCCI
jgi:hypothetical protein